MQAQIDFGRILRDLQRSQPVPQRPVPDAPSAQSCDTFKTWLAGTPAATAGVRTQADMLPLVEDARFSASFGKTYDQLTIDDFRRIQGDLRNCQRVGGLTPVEQQTASYVLNPNTQGSLGPQMAARRATTDELARLERELDTLEPTDASLARLDAIQSRIDALARTEPAERRAALASKVQAARDRITLPVEQARVQKLVAESQGAAGLAALVNAQAALGRSRLSPGEREPLRQQLADRIAQLAPAVVAEERARADALTGGAAGLEAGASWLNELDQRYRAQLGQLPELAALRAEVIARRAAVARETEPEIAARIAASRTASEASAIPARYFVADEMREGVARSLKAAADQRAAALESLTRDQAMFGVQPEHAALAAGPRTLAVRPPAHPTVERCDALAAHGADPGRQADGVTDEAIDASRAIAACAEALKIAPAEARLHFQYGRALLAGGRPNEAVGAFRRASERGHGGAYAYLGEAYTHGAGGLPKNPKLAEQHFAKAAELGFAAQSADAVLKDSAELKSRYEYGDLVKGVYYGESAPFLKDRQFANLYLVGQAQVLNQECQSIKLTELRDFQTAITRSQVPATQQQMMAQGARALQLFAEAMKNPQRMVEAGSRQQRLEDAGEYGTRDLVTFVKTYGGCGNAPLERYTRNLRHYMQTVR